MTKKKTKKKKVKKKLTPEERKARKAEQAKKRLATKFKTNIRTIFKNCGFTQIPSREVQLYILDRHGDLDGLYLYENIIVLVEDTAGKSHKPDHIRKKFDFARAVMKDSAALVEALCDNFEKLNDIVENNIYEYNEYIIKHLYCSMHDVSSEYQERYRDENNIFLSNLQLKYFLELAKTIKASSRFEMFKFLGIELADVGCPNNSSRSDTYSGLILSEKPNGFPNGYKVVSFFADPEMLLEKSYVLRKDSWRDDDCLYQRLLVKNKIKDIRKFLVDNKRTFVNNIIVTLPHDCTFKGISKRPKTEPVDITIPERFNIIGIIDGQHRVYAYHESQEDIEPQIKKLRKRQHLLVTGIVYPRNTTTEEKMQFEAKLFLEINAKQKALPGRLKQDIELIVKPNSGIAIAKAVLSILARKGPLEDKLEVHHFDSAGKIKTTSIVSYGLKHIVSIEGENSFYKKWTGNNKKNIREDEIVRKHYIDYCAKQLTYYIAGFKESIPKSMWVTDNKISKVLTPTTINGLIYCMRMLIKRNEIKGSQEEYFEAFESLAINFTPKKFRYISSHWKSLGDKIDEQCFKGK